MTSRASKLGNERVGTKSLSYQKQLVADQNENTPVYTNMKIKPDKGVMDVHYVLADNTQRNPFDPANRLFMRSPTRNTTSPRHSDSWQDASTEPLLGTPITAKGNSKAKHSDLQTPNPSSSKGTTPMLTKNPFTDIQNTLHTPISYPESKQTQSPPLSKSVEPANQLKRRVSDGIMEEAPPTKIIRESNFQDIKKTKDKANESTQEDDAPKEKTAVERIQEEITYLMKTVKGLSNYYKLMDKIGEGIDE
jgi:hypothetical protein